MQQIVQFTQDRDWDQFHNGKDLALALSIEASELNEAFLWKQPEDVCLPPQRNRRRILLRTQPPAIGQHLPMYGNRRPHLLPAVHLETIGIRPRTR